MGRVDERSAGPLSVVHGTVHVLYSFDVGASIDLDRARLLLADRTEPAQLRLQRRAPPYFQFDAPPVRVEHPIEPLQVGEYRGPARLEESLYDFGGVTLRYAFDFAGSLEELVEQVCVLSDSDVVVRHARAWAQALPERLGPAVMRPLVAGANEGYLVVELRELSQSLRAEELVRAHGPTLARILRAERGELAPSQVADALQLQVSYGPQDLVLIDWAGALVLDSAPEDALRVLELANLQLLEMRRGPPANRCRGWGACRSMEPCSSNG